MTLFVDREVEVWPLDLRACTSYAGFHTEGVGAGIPPPEILKLSMAGASLSEPHTSVPALRMRVCIYACLLGPTTYRKF